MDKKFVILMRLVRLGTINLHTINLHMYTQLAQTMCRAFWVTEALLLTPPTNLTQARGCPRRREARDVVLRRRVDVQALA